MDRGPLTYVAPTGNVTMRFRAPVLLDLLLLYIVFLALC